MDVLAKSQDFFQDNNTIGKKYTTTRMKLRNFLSDIAYGGINKEDYYNKNFIFDVYLLLTKNLSPYYLDRKLAYMKLFTCYGRNACQLNFTSTFA